MAKQAGQPTRSILIADDDPEFLEEVSDVFRRNAIPYRTAGDAETGVRLALRHKPDVVFFDFHLPDMTGLAAIEYLRERLPKTKFILISGDRDFCSGATTENTGTYSVLHKPLSLKGILRFVRGEIESGAPTAARAREIRPKSNDWRR